MMQRLDSSHMKCAQHILWQEHALIVVRAPDHGIHNHCLRCWKQDLQRGKMVYKDYLIAYVLKAKTKTTQKKL